MSLPQLSFSATSPNEQRLKDATNQLILGNTNNTGEVTLTENSATTTVKNSRVSANSVILFMPTTANAAAEMDGMYVSARKKGEFTITHANNAQDDRTFKYIHVG